MPDMKADRFVAYFDMLGMGSAVKQNTDQAWGALCDLQSTMDRPLGIKLANQTNDIATRVKKRILSDTVVLFTLGEEADDLRAITILASQLFADNLHRCVPLRGAITHGEFYFNLDLDLILGVPLVCACSLAEESQWLGITVDATVSERARKLPIKSGGEDAIIDWSVPLKGGKREVRPVVNWPWIFQGNFKKPVPIQVSDFYQAYKPLFGEFDSLREKDRLKYQNTVEFVNEQLKSK